MKSLIDLADRAWLPDALIRLGIRRGSQQRQLVLRWPGGQLSQAALSFDGRFPLHLPWRGFSTPRQVMPTLLLSIPLAWYNRGSL